MQGLIPPQVTTLSCYETLLQRGHSQHEQIVYKPHAPKNIWYTQKQNITFPQPEICPHQDYITVGMSFLLANTDQMQREQHSSAAETACAPKCGTQGMLI